MKIKRVDIFPLSVFCMQLGPPPYAGAAAADKDQLVQHALSMRNQSAPPSSAHAAWTGDVRGYEFIHDDPLFENLFSEIAKGVDAYFDALGLDRGQFNLYFTRSWVAVAHAGERISRHAHLQSHLSIAYYLTKPEQGGRIVLLDPSPPNQFAPGLFEPREEDLFIGPRNAANSNHLVVDVEEGDLVIFPSQMQHATEPHTATEPRITIVSDVLVTLSDSSGKEFMLPDPSHWKKMGSRGVD